MSVRRWSGVLLALLLLGAHPASGGEMTLPMTLDYPLLGSLLVMAGYTDPGETVLLSDGEEGCRRITLSDPRFGPDGQHLILTTRVEVQLGTTVAGKCLAPLRWEGQIALIQQPRIDAASFALAFQTLDGQVLDRHGAPAAIAGVLWEFVEQRVFTYLDGVRIDLSLPVAELKSFLWPLFPAATRQRTRRMLDSLHPGAIAVTPQALRIPLKIEVTADLGGGGQAPSEILSPQEQARLVERWETWDAFLVAMLRSLHLRPLTSEDRDTLLGVLLETRHSFVDVLAGAQQAGQDLVREQFIRAWERLAPIFRRLLGQSRNHALIGYLAFFTAADALAALDQAGPALGIEVSRNGLIRLVRLLGDLPAAPLVYSPEIDPQLRETLGIGAPPTIEEPEETVPDDPSTLPESRVPLRGLRRVLAALRPASVWAGDRVDASRSAPWLPTLDNYAGYIDRLQILLRDSAERVFQGSGLPQAYRGFYHQAVAAVAWQESCWRQFVTSGEGGAITCLRSYNGSSVGVMQINERVWRGIYDLPKLRSEIRYNARAGSEILDQYLRRYALKRLQRDEALRRLLKEEGVAQLLYAIYNGGPADLERFLGRYQKNALLASDRLFLEKYRWVKAGQWDNLGLCLFGAPQPAG
jgi:hypothetical protein